jgi:hypothetical protein
VVVWCPNYPYLKLLDGQHWLRCLTKISRHFSVLSRECLCERTFDKKATKDIRPTGRQDTRQNSKVLTRKRIRRPALRVPISARISWSRRSDSMLISNRGRLSSSDQNWRYLARTTDPSTRSCTKSASKWGFQEQLNVMTENAAVHTDCVFQCRSRASLR